MLRGSAMPLFLFLLLFDSTFAAGKNAPEMQRGIQDTQVTGTVTDSKGNKLPGVSILVKNQQGKGTTTNQDGRYNLEVPANAVLIFRFIGFKETEVPVNGRKEINVSLSDDDVALNEVVVTSMGIKKEKKALGYAVTEVKGEDFTKARETNIANSLVGKVAGVNVTKPVSGSMGSSRVIIRGNTSITGNNQPLYVIDGIPLVNTNFGQSSVFYGGSDGGDGISSINPDDIESMSVLKGGPAAALYGARASNGAILITTKSGKAQKGVGIEYNAAYTIDQPIFNNEKDYQYVYGQGTNGVAPKDQATAFQNGISNWGAKLDGSQVMQFDGVLRPYSAIKDNSRNFYNDGKTFTNTISLYGGSEKATIRFSASDLDNHDLMPNSSLKRNNFTLNGNLKVTDKFTAQVSAQYIRERVENRPNSGDFSWNPNVGVQLLPANYDVRNLSRRVDEKGDEYLVSSNIYLANPYFIAYDMQNRDRKDRLIASLDLKYDFTSYLYARLLAGTDFAYRHSQYIRPEGSAIANGSMSENQAYNGEFNSQLMIGFKKTIANDFSVDAFVGGNIMKSKQSGLGASGSQFIVPFFYSVNNTVTQGRYFDLYKKQFNSLFASAEIGYKGYLYATFTERNDWFSTLSAASNSILYPSASLSFVASQAITMPSWISFAKLRTAWARTGSDSDISPYAQSLTYTFGQQHLGQSLAYINEGTIPNTRLKPATSKSYELGLDTRLFNDRIGLELTWYNRKTVSDILGSQISIASGFTNVRLNSGEMTNKGLEMMVSGTVFKQKSMAWDMSFNMGYNKNNILSLADGQQAMTVQQSRPGLYGDGGVPVFITAEVGKPFGVIQGYGYKRDDNGSIIYNNKGLPVQGELTNLGNSVSPYTLGYNNNFRYKNFNLGILLDAKFGGKISSGTNNLAYLAGLSKETLAGRETGIVGAGVNEQGQPNTINVPAQEYYSWIANNISEEFVYDASFVKLRQVVLGVSLPKNWVGRLKMSDVSLSLVARNLFTLYKKVPIVDPESTFLTGNIQGIEMLSVPATRSFGLNLNCKF
ncbi:hypothetical protein BFS30_01905 [Pedobacter steynii]|uniref:TonB-dependent receptor plug domain-containing protein n=2 Tax=Pedobacter steynii TaxID=430522 RepID=A0A1D7QBS8_9SPHI|nr:hypothetical protein BFS30_01905 [Pedobacter steynii]